MIRKETSSTIPDLQQRLRQIFTDLTGWRLGWELENMPTAFHILDWALFRTGDDSYRPGIYGAQGPDAYGLNMIDIAALDLPFDSVNPAIHEPEINITTFSLMQEAALYITVLIWADRLNKNLTGAAGALDSVDFYNAPFFTQCHCYYDSPGPSRRCQIFPQPCDHVEAALSWNINSPIVSESPVRLLAHGPMSEETATANTTGNPVDYVINMSNSLGSDLVAQHQLGKVLLPGDVRFSAQLRILNWLVNHLMDSRRYVLGTLGAMGLSHCVHDVRPSEGNESIAETIRRTMTRSRFEGAADLLIRSYS